MSKLWPAPDRYSLTFRLLRTPWKPTVQTALPNNASLPPKISWRFPCFDATRVQLSSDRDLINRRDIEGKKKG